MWHPHRLVNILSLIIIAIFLVLSVIVVQYTIFTKQEADERNLISFTASRPAALQNQDFLIDVAVKKPDKPISGVYFSLTYPREKMELVGIDDWSSPFDMQTEEILGDGIIRYGRDSSKPLVGDQKIAVLKFKSKQPVDLSEISIAADASLVSTDLQNIISQRPVVRYEKEQASGTQGFFDWLTMIVTDFPRLLTQ
jgi:hypothetical protein